jgi:hypothetical protein
LLALDLSDPRIAEGMQISLNALRCMKNLADSLKFEFYVILIPTKEYVFSDIVASPGSDYSNLVGYEKQLWQKTTEFLQMSKINYIDVLPALRKLLLNFSLLYRHVLLFKSPRIGCSHDTNLSIQY